MSRIRSWVLWIGAVGMLAAFGGCGSLSTDHTGFISDYSSLDRVDETRARFVSPSLAQYQAFIVDPVVMQAVKDPPVLTESERSEIAAYFRESLQDTLRENGYEVTGQPATGVARVRFAVTDVLESIWWANLHPASKLTGAGTGGASMEGEIVDSVTGEQLAAVVKSGRGNQFELDTFSRLDDIKDVVDMWSEQAVGWLREVGDGQAAVETP